MEHLCFWEASVPTRPFWGARKKKKEREYPFWPKYTVFGYIGDSCCCCCCLFCLFIVVCMDWRITVSLRDTPGLDFGRNLEKGMFVSVH